MSDKKDGYSILVPAYKVENFIKECLDSIDKQTYFKNNKNYEILLGIDGCESTLETVKIIKDNYDNLKVLYMNDNKGTYITINTLVKEAVYDKTIIFGADDCMRPNMVLSIAQYMNRDIYDMCKFKAFNFTNDITKGKETAGPLDGVSCIKWKVYEKAGGYKPWRCGADTDFLFRIGRMFKTKIINKPLYDRRIHKDSLTQNPETGYYSELRKGYIKQLKRGFEHVPFTCNEFKII